MAANNHAGDPTIGHLSHEPVLDSLLRAKRSGRGSQKLGCKTISTPLIVTPVTFDSAVTIEQLDWALIKLHIRNALDQAYRADSEIDGTIVEDALRQWQERPHTPAPFPARGHNCLTPNQLVLRGAGFTFEGGEPFMPPMEADYIKAIVETARAVKSLREDLGDVPAFRISPPQPGLFLTSPSLYRHIYDRSPPTPSEFRDPQIFRETLKILQRQKGFQFHIAGDKGRRIMESEALAILHIRAEETAVHSLAVGLRAASTLAATLRLPPAVNTTAGAIRQLSAHTRATKAHNRKFGEIFATVQQKLIEAVGPDLVEEIKHYSGDIKLATDVPLEWLPIDGFPLSLLFYTSRITATPGNLMIGELANPNIMRFRTEAFREILILRSFDENDHIREYLPQALSVLEPRWKDQLTIRSVEVSSVDEFVREIDGYTGPIMIFDGHGGHALHDAGTLRIGKSDVDVWELRTRVRVPPIVVLSACDTHATDRSHATTANGFLTLGARTVLATLLPISGPAAAIFVARLLFRLFEYLPAGVDLHNRFLTWTEVVGGMLRMQAVSDLLRPMIGKKISEQQYRQIHTDLNNSINIEEDRGWLSLLINLVANQTGLGALEIHSVFRRAIAYSETIRDIQIGNPETILIGSEAVLQEHENSALQRLTSDPTQQIRT
jgi:hypothetical protein